MKTRNQTNKDPIDYEHLESRLRTMKPWDRLYKVVRDVLTERGNWKGKPRGKPWPKGFDPRKK